MERKYRESMIIVTSVTGASSRSGPMWRRPFVTNAVVVSDYPFPPHRIALTFRRMSTRSHSTLFRHLPKHIFMRLGHEFSPPQYQC